MAQGVRANLRQAVNDLLRQSGNAVEWEIGRNSPALVAAPAFDFALLAPEIPGVLDRRFCACDINVSAVRIEIKRHESLGRELLKTDFRTTKKAGRNDAISTCSSDQGFVQTAEIAFKPGSSGQKRLPTFRVHETYRAPFWCQPKVCVIDSQQQTVLSA